MEEINFINSKEKSEVSNMLNKLYEIFYNKFNDTQKAWDHFLEFIAIDNSAELILRKNNIEWLFDDKRFRDSVFSVYDSKLLKSVYYDHLGEMYFKLIKMKSLDQNLPEKLQTQIKILCKEKKDSVKILDSDMGTGRNLMAIHNVNSHATLFGITKELNLYRIALTNSLLFGINCYLLHTDNNFHELKLNSKRGIDNWKQANQWYNNSNKLLQNMN